jgi:hypothetical protein
MPIDFAVRMIRQAISPRLAIRILENINETSGNFHDQTNGH